MKAISEVSLEFLVAEYEFWLCLENGSAALAPDNEKHYLYCGGSGTSAHAPKTFNHFHAEEMSFNSSQRSLKETRY